MPRRSQPHTCSVPDVSVDEGRPTALTAVTILCIMFACRAAAFLALHLCSEANEVGEILGSQDASG